MLQEASPIAISRTIDYGKLLKLQYWQVVFALTCSAVQSNEKKMAQLTEEFQNLDSVPLRELKDIKHLANKQIGMLLIWIDKLFLFLLLNNRAKTICKQNYFEAKLFFHLSSV